MNPPSFRWQPWVLGLLGAGTAATLGWSIFTHFGAQDPFMPHAHCYLLKRDLILLHGISDFFIGLSYVVISATLVYLVLRARREIPFHWMMMAFATFIVACGGTHFMEVWTLQAHNPPYWFSGDLKLVTALASVVTALLLPPLVPKILRLLEEARLSTQRKVDLENAHVALSEAHEKVKQLDQLKTNFFANISHELRTPLTLILGPLERLLGASGFSESNRHELQVTRRNALLLHKHVDDLLDVSKLEAGRMRMHYARTDLASLTRLVASHFSSSNVRPLDMHIDAPRSLIAEVDAEKIQRVLFNLVSNAYKFTPEGGSVEVTARAEGDSALLLVTDTGPGVARESREAIFERFNQGDSPTSRGGAGTGLGLSIVKEFVELHHGAVSVGDGPGGGACFRVQLPLRAPEGTPMEENGGQSPAGSLRENSLLAASVHFSSPSSIPMPPPSSPPTKGPLILVAEDNPDMSDHIVRTLTPGYRVATAANGREALELAEREQPDLILTDLMMPEMGGEELVARLRGHATLLHVPVILLTARADDQIKFTLLENGAQDYIVKPFAAQELRARVHNQVTLKMARDTLRGELATEEQDVARLAEEVAARARELKAARDAAEAANRAKDQFLAVLSHELRTPLTPALVTAQRLEDQAETSSPEMRRALNVIRRNIELEAQLIDDLLDVTRIARGKLQLRLSDIDAHVAIRDAVEMCQSEIARKGSHITIELQAERHHVRGDAPRLLQVVWNLLLNAVKFTTPDGRIGLATSNDAEGHFVIEVNDTGIGISPELLPRIFEPFEQGEQARARSSGGLGLGLAVVKGLVDAHGGSISVSSGGDGLGTTFRVELATVEVPSVATCEAGAPSSLSTTALRILLVEDHEETREAMERLLTRWGHQVESASTVREGLQKAEPGKFDVLVSDLGLPDGRGTELMAELRQRDPRVIGIGVSGYGMEEDLRRSREAGFTTHLTKPIATNRLKSLLHEIAASLGKADGNPPSSQIPEATSPGADPI